MKILPFAALLAVSFVSSVFADDPKWIWPTKDAGKDEVRYFRKEFSLDELPKQAKLRAACDDEATVFVNGSEVGVTTNWKEPLVKPVEKVLQKGQNVIAVRGKNNAGAAGLIVRLDLTMSDGGKEAIVTDDSWKTADQLAVDWTKTAFDSSAWHKPVIVGKLGDQPWGDVFVAGAAKPGAKGTPPSDLETLPGFKVEMVLDAEKEKHGSWISLAKDDKGRLLLGSQTGNKITRLTLKDGKVVLDEDLNLPFSEPMGMLWANGCLYINGNGKATDGKSGHGIYRLYDTQNDGRFDKIEQIFEWKKGGGGEHGSHGMVVGPDRRIYVVSGNFVGLPDNLLPSSPHRNYAEDLILGRSEDGNGFGAGNKPPGGFIMRMDPDGKNPELYASGERNTYDIAFNADGELLAFDSDMEWDWGMPWYRPIRIYHAVSGADHGFREGSGKWPEYYPDSVPPVQNIGIGSPTGVVFGYGAKFPAKYQRAFYILDWTYGRLIAAHLQPNGATYSATWENFVAPKSLHGNGAKSPLDLTDVIIGDDGALYFTVGGRGTQASLYRVTYTGNESTAPVDPHDAAGREPRALRHSLEAYHGVISLAAVPFAWRHLSDPDRAIRYAARLAIESQPIEEWRTRALGESNPTAALGGLLALARLGGKEAQPALFSALAKFPLSSLDEEQQLEKIRIIEVSVSRNGLPEHPESTIAELDAAYPSSSLHLNRELCQTLLAFGAPDAVAKTMKLLAEAPTQEEQLTYVLYLRNIKTGWTPELRRAYFDWWVHRPAASHPDYVLKWFEDAGRAYGDGASFPGFLQAFHQDAEHSLTAEEIDKLQQVLTAYVPPNTKAPRKPAKKRAFVKMWEIGDLDSILDEATHGRNYENGKDAFAAAQCILCHRLGNEGGAVGPDLTAISARFSLHDILESIIDPSKVISEQYANEELTLKDGDLAVGRIVGDTDDKITLRPSLLAPEMKDIKKSDIKSRQLSKVSPMPPALLSSLSKDDILDLLAYLASGGKKEAPAFSK
ncbi:MAG TPA: heme-binding protein [Chthoniobacteraceae bacterium]|jgi:putative heme-binding domain-containing protein